MLYYIDTAAEAGDYQGRAHMNNPRSFTGATTIKRASHGNEQTTKQAGNYSGTTLRSWYMFVSRRFHLNISEVRTWALKGAEQRLAEIADEAKAIFRNFPSLRGKGRRFRADGAARQQTKAPARRRRKLSAEARKRISDAVKARWARQKAGKTEGTSAAPNTVGRQAKAGKAAHTKKRRGGARRMSAEARKRIGEAQRKRWAELKAKQGASGSQAEAPAKPKPRGRGRKKR